MRPKTIYIQPPYHNKCAFYYQRKLPYYGVVYKSRNQRTQSLQLGLTVSDFNGIKSDL